MNDIHKNFDVREFVPKEVYDRFGAKSWQFVSNSIVNIANFTLDFFTNHLKNTDTKIDKVSVLINNWHLGGPFSWRCLRTVSYINAQIAKGIKTAMLSQHIGGSSDAFDFNIIIQYKDGRKEVMNSNKVYDIIMANEKVFMDAGLTTLEDKAMTAGWTHGDCRFTGLDTLYIVKP